VSKDRDESLGRRLHEERSSEIVFRLQLLPHREMLYLSPSIVRLAGLEAAAFYADPQLLAEMLVPQDRSVIADLDFDTLKSGTSLTARVRTREGLDLWIEYILWPIREAGAVAVIDGSIRDVSRWQREAGALNRLSRMVSDAFDGLAGVDTQTLRFTEADSKARALMGLDSGEISSKGIADVFDDAACTKLIQQGSLITGGDIDRSSLETMIRHHANPDNDVFIRLSASNDDPPTLMLLFEDRTRELRLGVERGRLEAAVASATDAVAIVDSSHSFLFTNKAFHKLSGYSAYECVGFRPDIIRTLLPEPALWTSVGEREAWKGVVQGQGKGETPVDTLTSLSPVAEPGGENVSFVIVLHDITEPRAALLALARERGARNRLTDALAELDDRAPAEDVAMTLCHAALAMPGVAAAVILDLSLEADPRVLALSPQPGYERLGRHLLEPERVQSVLERDPAGSWIEPTASLGGGPDGPGFNLDGAALLSLSPIAHAGRTIGLLAVVGAESLKADLKSLAGLASTAGGLLGDRLIEYADKRRIRREITEILARRRFRPIFQPIINLADGGTVGWESTTRFDDGRGPSERFAEALRAGMAIELETAATRAAVSEAALNSISGWLSLNVSATFLASGERLLGLLPGPGRNVVLELAEASDLDDRARAAIANLPGHVRLAVDSTSREMHTLHAVVDLRPAFIKLPVDLVRGIDTDHVRQALVAGLEHFAHTTGSELIAVGVETEAEFETLMGLKVGYAQGNYLGPPGFFPISGTP
jgi:PAS domain S-box-containing protein